MHDEKGPDGAYDRSPIAKWNPKERQDRVGARKHQEVDCYGGSSNLQKKMHQIAVLA
jgi:hypothetical protein